jgi:hypothetical protein
MILDLYDEENKKKFRRDYVKELFKADIEQGR